MSYRAILPDGDMTCDSYEETDKGVEIFTADGEMIAFIPYQNLVAVVNEGVQRGDERSIM